MISVCRALRSSAPVWMMIVALSPTLLAHGVSSSDHALIQGGRQLAVFLYLGAKHMVTGYDHLLFLFGVIFFLYRLRDVAAYVTLFAVGHSVTLLYGVLMQTAANAYVVDAIIGFSVVYKALDNIGTFTTLLGVQPNTRAAVLIFGFVHGFGLATKLQDFALSSEGLVENLVAFNVGVELGQLLALGAIVTAMTVWRTRPSFTRQALAANVLLMAAGFVLVGYQLTGYWVTS